MSKVVFLILIISIIQCFDAKIVFQKPSLTSLSRPPFYTTENGGVRFSHSVSKYVATDMPPDNGGNFGDSIHMERKEYDVLVLREIVINERIFDEDVQIDYFKQIYGRNITTIRAVNLGRQRAYVIGTTSSEDGIVKVSALIRKNEQIRLLIEAYAEPLLYPLHSLFKNLGEYFRRN